MSRTSGWPQVAEHYQHFGGVSPINEQNRELLAAIREDFAAHGLELALYWGNRNWYPYVADTVRTMVRRWRQARARPGDQRDIVLLGVSAVPGEPGRRAGRARAVGPAAVQTAPLFRPPGLRCRQRGPGAGRPRRAAARPAHECPSGVHRAFHPGVDERRVRAPPAACTSTSTARRRAWWPRRYAGRGPSSIWSGSPAPGRPTCRGSSPISTITCGRWPPTVRRPSS